MKQRKKKNCAKKERIKERKPNVVRRNTKKRHETANNRVQTVESKMKAKQTTAKTWAV